MHMLNFDLSQWILVIIAAFIAGFAKTGIGGVTMLIIPILASVFGGKDSTGILLPMLLVGDIFAIIYYHRSAQWKDVVKPLPSALAGVILGGLVGSYISDTTFIRLIGLIVFNQSSSSFINRYAG
ncbi:MAG TPA: sulfite exporter TauE/SafE family protein [Clostridiales bacterium]|nr:sulfite exporter TauE/SafE family protein [Clostridiales bacterium]